MTQSVLITTGASGIGKAMAVFLAFEKARFISGQIIGIDGHTENPDPKV